MLRLRVTTERQPRTKKGQPAHKTTGVAITSWTQFDNPAEMYLRADPGFFDGTSVAAYLPAESLT